MPVHPGKIECRAGDIELRPGRRRVEITVTNVADRPVQVGSHAHFYEINAELQFDREAAYGMCLDVAAGTAVRFEPGITRPVTLVAIGGERRVHGLRGLVEGPLAR